MAYENIRPKDDLLVIDFQRDANMAALRIGGMEKKNLPQIPVNTRQALICGILMFKWIFHTEFRADNLSRLGDSFKSDSDEEGIDENLRLADNTLTILASEWPYDYKQANSVIYNSETAMVAIAGGISSKSQTNEAYAPRGSKGFFRYLDPWEFPHRVEPAVPRGASPEALNRMLNKMGAGSIDSVKEKELTIPAP